MLIQRKLTRINTPKGQPGFLGPGHTARAVIQVPYQKSDPFIMLMDDWLDKKDEKPVGGPHPHAGFETVTLVLEGEMGDGAHRVKAGDFQLMTAGSGIIHTETIDKIARMRILQLWLTLPKRKRWALPRIQDLPLQHVPEVKQDGHTIKVYSGSFAGVSSPVHNYVPLIVADIELQPGVLTVQQLPATFTAFLYTIEGSIRVGEEGKPLNRDQVGWLDRNTEEGPSELKLMAGPSGGRIILYSGQPQGNPIVSHGPFIADTREDIQQLYREYRQGKMDHISEVGESQKIRW